MAFKPLVASKEIAEKYKRYLRTIFEISDKDYAEQFLRELNKQSTFASGPYLDVTDSFVKGASITQMIDSGKLPKSFIRFNIPKERPLYKHQEAAINKVIQGKNIVVSTGTGSGKTESFLYPILRQLAYEEESGILDEGVRALIIYPMNALANDQIERLREILIDYPTITFGSYTGQTKEKYDKSLSEYKVLNNSMPLSNEIISREQMKEKPPHILITNYSMLEYLMLRPEDSIFFSQHLADRWKYIVLDEAHVYNGSTGIEVSMLLRRLKATLANDNIQYILTSATLGGENDNIEVADFASNLCDSTFQQDDVIRAQRYTPKTERETKELGIKIYDHIADLINQGNSSEVIRNEIAQILNIQDRYASLEEMLYDQVLHDQLYWQIRKLMIKPLTITSLSGKLNLEEEQIANFVTVAARCDKDGDKLFDARYHMFLRASESVFITLSPSKKLFLNRKKHHIENDGTSFHVFEIATCTSCHSIYLVGKQEGDFLLQASSFLEDKDRVVFLLADSIHDTDEDHTLDQEKIKAEEYELCSRCGYLHKVGRPDTRRCEHGKEYFSKVIRIQINNESGRLTKCIACENTSTFSMLRQFFTGQEAVTSVIGTALFEALPSYSFKEKNGNELKSTGGFGITAGSRAKQAKQFLAFSDNRQAAAYYATYLDQTYKNILNKRLIIEALKNTPKEGVSVPDFVERLIYEYQLKNISEKSHDKIRKSAWTAILSELVDNNGNTALKRMGLLAISIDSTHLNAVPEYHLTKEEVLAMYSVFALGMMSDAAILNSANMNNAERAAYTNGVEYSYTFSDANPKSYQRSFIPTKANLNNKRLDYFSRVLSKAGIILEYQEKTNLLKDIWEGVFTEPDAAIMQVNQGKFKLNPEKVIVSKGSHWYTCTKCRKLTNHYVKGVCPTYRCEGELEAVDVSDYFKNNHYHQIYQNMDIRELRIREHTAQLNKEQAYDFQRKFKQKEIDILSCSTTFEMGVDVGTLETVFMRNMPPSPSNYAQRAGRAGRSRHSAAYALTFCNKSNHDFTFFRTPEKMIRGKINPPKFNVENDKIAIRHLYASALSLFWKKHKEYFSKTTNMVDEVQGEKSGVDAFEEYLRNRPNDLKIFLMNFLPKNLADKYDVINYGWLDSLLRDDPAEPGVLQKAIKEYHYEVDLMEEELARALKEERFRQCDLLKERIDVYKKEDVLAFLSRKNILPKYGFPVDTVELSVLGKSENSALGLQLQRDLSIAISEYAPGSQVVANGNLITSRYIRKIPTMSWKMYDYKYCDKCKTLNIEPHLEYKDNSALTSCVQCGEDLNDTDIKTFLIPSFGFEADANIEKPGLTKPERTFKGEIAYVGYKSMENAHKYKMGEAIVDLQMNKGDEMAVLNQSNFFVCESCGYTRLEPKIFAPSTTYSHRTSTGQVCKNNGENKLKRYSLGYRFETDVVQLRFMEKELTDREEAISVLYGLLRGITAVLNVEQSDISGCLHYFINDNSGKENYGLIIYDTTPGGAGHVRRLDNPETLEKAIEETIQIMNNCTCGGEAKDSSCYTCLRGYYNQKYHDILQRKYVINYLSSLKETKTEVLRTNAMYNHDGTDLSEKTMEEIWEYIKLDTRDEEEISFLDDLIALKDNSLEKPKYGASILVPEDKETIIADLLWPKSKVLFFLQDNEDRYRKALRTNWKCFCIEAKLSAQDLIELIKE